MLKSVISLELRDYTRASIKEPLSSTVMAVFCLKTFWNTLGNSDFHNVTPRYFLRLSPHYTPSRHPSHSVACPFPCLSSLLLTFIVSPPSTTSWKAFGRPLSSMRLLQDHASTLSQVLCLLSLSPHTTCGLVSGTFHVLTFILVCFPSHLWFCLFWSSLWE